MINFLIRRPIAVIMVFIAIMMLGYLSYRLLPVSLMPDIDIPEITVQVSYPNSPSRELENTVVRKLRAQLMQVAHLSDIKSETTDGKALIKLSFDYSASTDYAFIEVNEKIDAVMGSLPRDMDRPRVIKASATDLPVFYLTVSFIDSDKVTRPGENADVKFLEVSRFCENVLRKRIEQLPSVALVDISGTTSPEILVKPDKHKMESLGLGYTQIQQAVEQSNISPGSIMVRDGYYQYYFRFSQYLKNPEDIGNIYIRSHDRVLQLKEVASIVVRPQKERGLCLSGNKRTVTMAIIKQSDTRMEDLREETDKLFGAFSKDYPELKIEKTQDQTQLLTFSMSNLKQDLILGCLMAFLLLFVFLSDFRAPLLIGITVPMSLVISFLFFKIFHLSINIISLSGLALGIGMIIDCSIIVIENILHYKHKGLTLHDACVRGTNEVIRPMLSSTLTTSSVFMPLIFLSGLAGAMFYDEAISVSIGNAASFVVSITILPVMFALLYGWGKISAKKPTYGEPAGTEKMGSMKISKLRLRTSVNVKRMGAFLVAGLQKITLGNKLEEWYEHRIAWVFSHKRITTFLFLGFLLMNVFLYRFVKKERLPEMKQTELVVHIDWNENIHLNENQRRVNALLQQFKSRIIQSNSLVGEQQFVMNRQKTPDYFEAEIYMNLKDEASVALLRDSLRLVFKRSYPDAKISTKRPDNIFEQIFSKDESPLMAYVMINDATRPPIDSIIQFVKDTDDRLNTLETNQLPVKQHLSIQVNPENLLLYNVSYSTVEKAIKTAFDANQFAVLRSYAQFMPIVLGDDLKTVNEVIASQKVKNETGEELSLSSFITIQREYDLKYITSGQQGEYVLLRYSSNEEQVGSQKKTIREMVREYNYQDVQFGGSLEGNEQMYEQLAVILCISILLLYFILAAQFESLTQPLIVLLEIPIDIGGALFLLWIFGSSLNIMSGIGIIIMCGVIINDSILKVDTINQLRREGLPLVDAIKEGGILRLRSILMTALTTIFAVIPFFWSNDIGSELQQPLSLALIGGMMMGTIVSLFFIPLAYYAIYRKEERQLVKTM